MTTFEGFLVANMREWAGGAMTFSVSNQRESDTLPWEYSKTVMKEERGCCWRRKIAWGSRYEGVRENQRRRE